MATARLTWFGAVICFDHAELTQITNHMNFGSAVTAAAGLAFATAGVTGPAAITSLAVAAALRVGATGLIACNRKQAGICLVVVWVGVPWCRSQ
jgi:hypothetical protein